MNGAPQGITFQHSRKVFVARSQERPKQEFRLRHRILKTNWKVHIEQEVSEQMRRATHYIDTGEKLAQTDLADSDSDNVVRKKRRSRGRH